MSFKILAILSLFSAALIFSGCDGGTAQMGPKEANLLGIAKVEKESYTPSSATTFVVSTDELYERRNVQGSKYTFLWGLVTIKDY